MITTRKKSIKKIEDLSFDLEIMNPIESKALFGGGHYLWTDTAGWVWVEDGNSWTTNNVAYGPEITIGGNNNHFTNFSYYDNNNPTLNGGYHNDWNNYGGNGNGSGGDPNWQYPNYDQNQVIDPVGELPHHSTHICFQAPQSKTCATMALSYVANYFGATGLSSSDFAEMNGLNYNNMLLGTQEGLNYYQLHNTISNIFQSTQISTYEEIVTSLNNGNPILATFQLGGDIGHEVVITNLNLSTGDMTYMDSLTGSPVMCNLLSPTNSIVIGTMYSVSGVQNNSIVNQYKNDTNDVSACPICHH